jgi:hypothetical protein
MPHKYQREIEEILRNMDLTEPRRGVGERVDASQRPASRLRLRGPSMRLRLTPSELLLLSGVVLALAAFCVDFYATLPTIVSGLFGLAAVAAIIGGWVVGWTSASQSLYTPSWRSTSASRSTRSDNVVNMRPRRRGPFGELITQARLLWLKARYLRKRDR